MLEIKNTSRNYQGKEEKAGQDVNMKQLHARSTLISEARAGRQDDSGRAALEHMACVKFLGSITLLMTHQRGTKYAFAECKPQLTGEWRSAALF